MSPANQDVVEALRVALKERDRLRKENTRLLEGSSEPIAIVGMSCRYPGGVASPQQLWELVANGRDAITEFPSDRGWDLERIYDPDPETPGTSYTQEGGFLVDAAEFDPAFFGVSPRDAAGGDPQHRLMLEASWEALEDAGTVPASLHGSQTGVFVGCMYHDYGWEYASVPDSADAGGPAVGSGSALSGRVAYYLGLEGQAITVDTACSSSLVAIHLATQALRSGECSLALAGGVTVISTPRGFVESSQQRGLAPDGRCKSFAESADGVGFAEGVGIVVLERLSDADREGHRVLATIRGSAVNQDGASNGITAPNGPSQERVIRQALANARLEPQDVDAVEAHGTGTMLGDPIEAGALLATYGRERETPLRLGSIKSNIGHSQAAAGVAGVIKTVMAMREGVLPKTLHVDQPSSQIDWEAGEIELLTEATEWKPNGHPRRAGVSSFGASGTNAHLILEEAPASKKPQAEEGSDGAGDVALPGQVPLVLSAKSDQALGASAGRLASHLEANPELDLVDVAHSLTVTRSSFERRAAIVGSRREELLAGLAALSSGSGAPALVTGMARADRDPVFLFPGYGSQWLGMALELIEASPVFARRMRECTEALEPHLEWALDDILRGAEGVPSLDWALVGTPALFATMVSLVELWRACGVEPAAVAGHSQGEMVAAHVAGGLSLDDAAQAAMARMGVVIALDGHGAMASVALSGSEVESRLGRWSNRIDIAALNGPSSTVVSGESEALDELIAQCASEGVKAKKVPGASGASHSVQVDALRDDLLRALAPISPRSGEIPFYSTVTGGVLDTAELDAEYWYRNLRQTVRLAPTVERLLEDGHRTLLEVSPHPVLAVGLQETVEASAVDPDAVAVLGTLRRDDGGPSRFATSLARAHTVGARVDWSRFFAGTGAASVALPTYPFQRKRYWLETGAAGSDPSAIGLGDSEHPLLRAAIEDPEGERLTLTGRISLRTHPWLADHSLGGTASLPGPAFLELALAAAAEAGCNQVKELKLEAPLFLPEADGVQLQVRVGEPGEDRTRPLSIHSRPEGGEWACHARGTVAAGSSVASPGLGSWPPADADPIDVNAAYDRLADFGFDYGPAFQGLTAAWRRGEDVFAEISLAPEQAQEAKQFGIHPALLDPVLHAVFADAFADGGSELRPLLASAWTDASLIGGGVTALRARITRRSGDEVTVTLADQEGAPVAAVGALILRPAEVEQPLGKRGDGDGLLGVEWVEPAPAPHPAAVANGASPTLVRLDELRFEPSADPAEAAHAAAAAALAEVQRWLADSPAASRLALLTTAAVSAAGNGSPDLPGATVWGLLRAVQAEHPDRFALIDTDGSEASAAALAAALAASAIEPQIALREGVQLVPRIVSLGPDSDRPSSRPGSIDPDRTVLIAGGTGRIGAIVARHLAGAYGARHLLLASRRGADAPGAAELIEQLGELGAEVRVEACDISDREELASLLDSIEPAHPLGAVIHAAAVADDGLIGSMSGEQLGRALDPKLAGAWRLHDLTEQLDLSAFIVFGAAASVLGGVGQANNAAGDAFLEALAQRRCEEGLGGSALAWGPWDRESGVSSHLSDAELKRMERSGFTALSVERALSLLDTVLSGERPLTLAAPFEPATLRAAAEAGALPPLLSGLVRTRQRRRGASAGGSLGGKLAELAEVEREGFVLDLVRSEAAIVLGHDSAAEVEPARAFKDIGFDSAGAVELRNRLGDATGMRLAATIVFDYPSPLELARHLLEQASGEGSARQEVVRAQISEEPIAIVGMSCRYPGGASSPQGLWRLLAEGDDAITGFPADRGWDLERLYDPDPESSGTSYAREGGFLPDAPDFDPAFFGISPREALASDPQQRLLLETSWEALEDAGIDPLSLHGTSTGIFAGVSSNDYTSGLTSSDDGLDGYRLFGVAASMVSGRVAYSLGLEGPTMSVDTACSSSLVAMHLASQALRAGECSLALAGGVTVIATPISFTEFARQRGLAPDGRCKAFAESADGVGWSEGVGVLALERLSDAEAKGHRVLAVIRGSAVNQDGASNGLTAPNGPSQERVIRQALANARLQPQDIDAVEAHGTGTMLGDPIEAGALLATYGQERETPLRLGSVKSNIGHSQAAAGVAGVIKTVMAMREGVLPKTLHVDAPSSKVDWEAGEIELLTEATEWKPNGHPRRAGVSSFGASGTNAHLILEEAPMSGRDPGPGASAKDAPAAEASLAGPLPFILSAKTPQALKDSASRLATHIQEHPELEPTDLAHSLITTRAQLSERALIVGSDRDELLEGLAALAQGKPAPNTKTQTAKAGRLAYLLTGQGSQRPGMGKELHETYPAYAKALEEACEQIDQHTDHPLKELIFSQPGSKQAALLERTTYAQPAIFATGLALYRLLESFGLTPDLLTGHSVGEITAAHISGVFSLADAAKLIAARGALMGALPEGGAMLAIEATEPEALEAIEGKDKALSLAAVNGPEAVVISGEEKAIEAQEAHFKAQDRKTKRLAVSHAFHSPLIEPMLEDFKAVLASLTLAEPKLPVISNASGELLSKEQAQDPAYWVSHAREPVRFAKGIQTLAEQGTTTYLELGADPLLGPMASTVLQEGSTPIPTLRQGRDEPEALILALAQAHAAGAKPDWSAFFAGTGAKAVPLPTYPFQRKRYWLNPSSGSGDPSAIGQVDADHPLLSATIEDPATEGLTLTGRISLQTHPWLADHAAAGTVLLPGTAFVEMALRAGREAGCELLQELALQAPLILPEQGAVALQVKLGAEGEGGEREVSIYSRPESSEAEQPQWTLHALGTLSSQAPQAKEPLTQWPPEGAEPIELDSVYERLAEAGFDYGPAFQGLERAWRAGGEVYAEVSLAEEQRAEAQRFGVHPALLDSSLHGALLPALEPQERSKGRGPVLPFVWSDIRIDSAGSLSLRTRLQAEGDTFVLDAFDATGAPVLSIGSVVGREIDLSVLGGTPSVPPSRLYRLGWQSVEQDPEAPVPSMAILGEGDIQIDAGDRYPDIPALLQALEAGVEPPEVVLWAFEPAGEAGAPSGGMDEALATLQQWIGSEALGGSRLALLTVGAIAGGEVSDLAFAPFGGLLRSAQFEHPGRFALIHSDGTEVSWAVLGKALAMSAEESQLALREGELLAPRVSAAQSRADSLLPPRGPWRLDAPQKGTLEELALVPAFEAESPLEEGAVRIAVRAAGVNSRDLMAVLAIYPDQAEIGGEGAGVVTEVGPGVEDLAVGDRVLGMFPHAFGPLAIADRRTLAPIPEAWSFEQGAAVPTVFCTAYYGLRDLGRLEAGEKVLIHAAANDVGLAAIALAHQLGAEVFATASPAKWETLKEAGVAEDHIAASHEQGFEERFLELTEGEGVDVVLNSLAGEFVDASLGLLPRGGRFLEMGKADIRDPEQVAAAHPGVVYRPYDLTEVGSDRLGEILAEVVDGLEREELSCFPHMTWDIRRAREAFLHLREGKVVLQMPQPIDPQRTVLITGATGGLGSLLAPHLVTEYGARHLLLLSRSGPEAASASGLSAQLTELGAEVRIEACDVSDREQLKLLIDSIDPEHPLGAVIHTAGVIEDGLIDLMSVGQLDRVLGPKADAAWHLHELTKQEDISAFVMFSSMAGTVGGPGQGNYAAANAFLDALAAHRQARGKAATSIAWGMWERESGMTANLDQADMARMRRFGAEALSDEEGLELFDEALLAGGPGEIAIKVDQGGLRKLATAGMLPPILRGMVRQQVERRRGPLVSLAERLARTPLAEHEATVLELVREEAAAVLGYASAADVPPKRPFAELGFDSLAAVEMRNRLGEITSMRLPATLIFDYPSAAALAGYLLTEVKPGEQVTDDPDFEQLERTLAAIPAGDARRETFATHLRALAGNLESTADEAAGDDVEAAQFEQGNDSQRADFMNEQVGQREE